MEDELQITIDDLYQRVIDFIYAVSNALLEVRNDPELVEDLAFNMRSVADEWKK